MMHAARLIAWYFVLILLSPLVVALLLWAVWRILRNGAEWSP